MVEDKINPDSILVAEYNYISRSAFQANEDRAKVSTLYLLTVGSFLAALLSLHSDVSQVPLEMVARCGANDGAVVAVELIHRVLEAERAESNGSQQVARQALLAAGAAAVHFTDRYPVRDPRLRLTPEGSLLGAPPEALEVAEKAIQQYLVSKIRQWGGLRRRAAAPPTRGKPMCIKNQNRDYHSEIRFGLNEKGHSEIFDPNNKLFPYVIRCKFEAQSPS